MTLAAVVKRMHKYIHLARYSRKMHFSKGGKA
nr:MAG TPA: hypothetical protein [Bacteriophage sp.]